MDFSQHHHKPSLPIMKVALVALFHAAVFSLILNEVRTSTKIPFIKPVTIKFHEPEPKPAQPLPQVPQSHAKLDFLTTLVDPPVVYWTVTGDKQETKSIGDAHEVIAPKAADKAGEPGGTGISEHVPVRVAAEINASACDKPDYPDAALHNQDTGIVTLAMLIGTDGRVIDAKIEQSSGHRDLDKAARAGLSLCKFKPGTIDGVPQQSWTKMKYEWTLD